MIEPTQAGAALLLGLAGAGHCLGMCGGIAIALEMRSAAPANAKFFYHGGRLLSYSLLGGFFGLLSGTVAGAGMTMGLRYVAGALLVAMGLYVGRWWLGMQYLERAGARLFAPLQSFFGKRMARQSSAAALGMGLVWGLMPCGLIYSSLAWSAAAGQGALPTALLMLLFGLGTLPAMLSVSLGASRLQQILRSRGLKQVIGLTLIIAGCWTLYGAGAHGGHAGHGGHENHGTAQPVEDGANKTEHEHQHRHQGT